tara:strand:+ start:1461 stop:1781 length:321 start_codon:yes stop_codon:yes gene_type:complete
MEKIEKLLDSYNDFIQDEEWDCVIILKKKTHDKLIISSEGNLSNIIPVFTVSEFVNAKNQIQDDQIKSIKEFILNTAANILADNEDYRNIFMAGVYSSTNKNDKLN